MSTPQQILVPVDFSEPSGRALAYAQDLAGSFGASLHLVHVVPDPHAEPWSVDATGFNLGSLLETWEADAQGQLEEIKPDTVPCALATPKGQPVQKILAYAAEHPIDLIVMGTHGRGAIDQALLGSVAERVVRKAPCPVLTVR